VRGCGTGPGGRNTVPRPTPRSSKREGLGGALYPHAAAVLRGGELIPFVTGPNSVLDDRRPGPKKSVRDGELYPGVVKTSVSIRGGKPPLAIVRRHSF